MQQDRMTRIEVAVFGWTGDNGLMGDRAKHSARISAIEDSLTHVRILARAARWLILAGAALSTLAGSEQIAAWLAVLLRAAASAIKA